MDPQTNPVQSASFWEFKGKVDYVDEWFLMGSPFPVLLIFLSYIYFVLKCGPKFMENRPAFQLRKTLLVYNLFQVIYSLYLTHFGMQGMLDYGLTETGCLMEDKAFVKRLVWGHHLYFIAKLTELLDTVFFVLRKKKSQITGLHLYHHSLMFLLSWATLKYEPSFSLIFLGTLNSFVHVIMYAYYGLSAFPELAEYLWWKKYITKLQLVQFLLIAIQVTWNWVHTACPLSYILISVTWSHLVLFIYLFTDFYIQSYIKTKQANK